MEVISLKEFKCKLYNAAFLEDDGQQRWDSGLWIRYKLVENIIAESTVYNVDEKDIINIK